MSRETDIEVAKVLGWTDIVPDGFTPAGKDACGTPPAGVAPMWNTGRSVVPHYSSEIADAMSLLPVMRTRGLFCKIVYYWTEEYGVWVSFDEQAVSDPNPLYQGHGDTVSEAICAAFLKANIEVKEAKKERP